MPALAAALLIIPSTVTNLWQLAFGGHLSALLKRLWPMLLLIFLGTGLGTVWLGMDGGGWVVEEQGLANYVVTKHNHETDEALLIVMNEVKARGLLDGLYVHGNGNNLAFLPDALQKQVAVREWIRRDQAINGKRPILGFGDSVSDLGFMTECDWWGTPKRGQLASHVMSSVTDE